MVSYCDYNVPLEKFGNTESIDLILSQSRDNVSGVLTLSANAGPVQGSITAQGRLILNGILPDRIIPRGGVQVEIQSWSTALNTGAAMTGQFAMLATDVTLMRRLAVWTAEIRGIPQVP